MKGRSLAAASLRAALSGVSVRTRQRDAEQGRAGPFHYGAAFVAEPAAGGSPTSSNSSSRNGVAMATEADGRR
jgi:hypothetical protein